MASPLTPKQWIIIILVNVVVSAVTTLVIVRILVNQPFPKTAGASNVAAEQMVTPEPPTLAPQLAPQSTQAQTAQTAAAAAASQPNTPTARPAAALAPTNAATKTGVPTAAPPAQNNPSVRISAVLYPGQRQREVVVIVNEGNEIDLKGWTLSASRNFTYTFGDVTLFKDSFINLHSTSGADVPTDLFWNRTDPAWQTGDVLTLANKDQVIATFTVK